MILEYNEFCNENNKSVVKDTERVIECLGKLSLMKFDLRPQGQEDVG